MPVLAASTSLQRTSLRDQALTALRQAIVTGQIKPGVVYSAGSLAAELGVPAAAFGEGLVPGLGPAQVERLQGLAGNPFRTCDRDMWMKGLEIWFQPRVKDRILDASMQREKMRMTSAHTGPDDRWAAASPQQRRSRCRHPEHGTHRRGAPLSPS